MGWRFNPPPGWPAPPPGWVPGPGWQPDPTWPPVPPGWQLWLPDGAAHQPMPPPAPPAAAPPRPPVAGFAGDDAAVSIGADGVLVTFTGKFGLDFVKRGMGSRFYPWASLTNCTFEPGRRGGVFRLQPRPGADALRPLLRKPDTGAAVDIDCVRVPEGASGDATAVAAQVTDTLRGTSTVPEAMVVSGTVPVTITALGSALSFDGHTITFRPKRGAGRDIPLEAVADVVVNHPRFTGGYLRFVLVGQPEHGIPAKDDPNAFALTSDNSQAYAVLAAAVLTARRSVTPVPHPELYPAAPTQATRQLPAAVPADAPHPGGGDAPTHRASADSDLPAVRPSAAVALPASAAAAKPTWRERHAEHKADKAHAKAVETWQAEQHTLDALAAAARAAQAGTSRVNGFLPKAGEVALWAAPAALIEPRRQQGHYVGGYSGISMKIAPGVRYRVGSTRGRYVPGPEVQTPVDRGTVVVTTRRIVFTGGLKTREWAFDKLIGVDTSSNDREAMLHVSNRQTVSGVSLGKAGPDFQTYLALGVAISQSSAAAVAEERAEAAEAHRSAQP